jgi:hypothetical protein
MGPDAHKLIAVLVVVSASWLLLPVGVSAAEVTLLPVADATLYEPGMGVGVTPLANGAGDHLFAGVGNAAKRAVLRFDLAAVPLGSTIDSVELTLNMSRNIAGPQDVSMHRLTTAWNEGPTHAPGQEGAGGDPAPGDSTWLHTDYDTDFWTTPGGDFVATPSATTAVDVLEVPYTWGPTADLASDVQSWVNDPASNFGWILIGNEGAPTTAKRFDSRENVDAGVRPTLRVVFTPALIPVTDIPALDPRALAFLALLLLAVGARRVGRSA